MTVIESDRSRENHTYWLLVAALAGHNGMVPLPHPVWHVAWGGIQ